jgi:hypothetical protein
MLGRHLIVGLTPVSFAALAASIVEWQARVPDEENET